MRFLALLCAILMQGCASDKPSGKTEAEAVYKEAKELMEDGHYQFAQERLNEIKSKYPYSFYATHAELMAADILYKQENYVEAASAYTLFKDFHPKYNEIDYVVWKIAESYNQQIPTFDRDLTPAHQAIKYYEELLSKYPNSKYSESSKENINRAKDKIMMKERHIADFYFKTEKYGAAAFRYLDLLKNFHRPKEFVDHAKIRVVESYFNQKKWDECKMYYGKYISSVSEEGKNILNRLKECK